MKLRPTELDHWGRSVVALCITWIVLANWMYFSGVDTACHYGEGQLSESYCTTPSWMPIWSSLTLNANFLYLYSSHVTYLGGEEIWRARMITYDYDLAGHIAFMLLPLAAILLVAKLARWVIRGNK